MLLTVSKVINDANSDKLEYHISQKFKLWSYWLAYKKCMGMFDYFFFEVCFKPEVTPTLCKRCYLPSQNGLWLEPIPHRYKNYKYIHGKYWNFLCKSSQMLMSHCWDFRFYRPSRNLNFVDQLKNDMYAKQISHDRIESPHVNLVAFTIHPLPPPFDAPFR